MRETLRRISTTSADITRLDVDAIVNAANSALSGGGGVDGAIHRAAGPGLLAACRPLGRCHPGCSVITPGFDLPARFVIHTVGPVWSGGDKGEAGLLRSCYQTSRTLAVEHELEEIAFPAISCGAYRYPVLEATRIAVGETLAFLEESPVPRRVQFCCFGNQVQRAYDRALSEAARGEL